VTGVLPAGRLSALLQYPDATFFSVLKECRDAGAPGTESPVSRFARGIEGLSIKRLQELYVDAFDLDPSCTLDLGWHLFGETYERGALLARLRAELCELGIAERNELPDHLPTVLVLLDRLEDSRRAELRGIIAPALGKLHAALAVRANPYAHLITGVLATDAAGG